MGRFRSVGSLIIVTAIPKGALSPERENYRPISITPNLSKGYEKLVSHKDINFVFYKKRVFFAGCSVCF